MATSIVIGGRRTNKPGAHSQVKSQTGTGQGPSARGIVAILGTAEGGKPLDATSTFADATSPDGARRLWRGGNMRKAALFAFEPSRDDAIPGGASRVIGVKVNPATQSQLALYDAEGSPVAIALSKDYGAFTERVSVDVENGTSLGKRLVYDLDAEPEEFDNVGGGAIMRVLSTVRWSSVLAATTGHARRFLYEAYVTGNSVHATDAAANAVAFTGGTISVVSTDASDTQTGTVYGIDNLGAPLSAPVTMNGLTPVVIAGNWSRITGLTLVREPRGQVNVRDNASVVWLSLSTTQRSVGVNANLSSPTLTGRAIRLWAVFDVSEGCTRKVVVRGTDATDTPVSEAVTLTGATPVQLTTDFKSITQVETGDVASGKGIFVKALASSVDYVEYDALRVAGAVASPFASPVPQTLAFSPTGAGTFTANVRGIDDTGAYISEGVSVTNAPVTTAALWRKVLGLEITSPPTMPIALSAAFVGSLPIGITSYGSSSFDVLTTVPSGAPVYVRATSKVNRIMVAVHGVTVGGSPETKLIELIGDRPILVSSTWARITRIDHLQLPTTVTAEVIAPFFTASGATYDTIAKMVAKIAAEARIEATVIDASEASAPFNQIDSLMVQTNLSPGANYFADLRKQVTMTGNSSYVILQRDSWSAGSLGNIGTPRYLTGGIEGVATINEWVEAFKQLKKRRANTVIVLTEDSAVQQLLFNYVRSCAAELENECNGYVGIGTVSGAGETRVNIKSAIVALQGRLLSFVSQEFRRADPDTGEDLWWPPYMLTAIAAGMQAGSAIGEPLTRKLVQIDEVRNDPSWNVEEDVEEMIDAGLMMIENDDNTGLQWVRSITGHLANNDPVFCEMSAVESLNESVYALRAALDLEIGKRALAPTVGLIKSAVVKEMADQVQEPMIRDWKPSSLAVEEIGDTFPVTLEIMPILGVNFIPITVNVGVVRSTPT